MTRRSQRKQSAIPSIPFQYYEIQSLVNGIASRELYQRFMVWKSTEYLNIKQVENMIISAKNNDSSIHLKELRSQYFDWLVSIESDKFRVLESVWLPMNLVNGHRDDNEKNADGEHELEVQKTPEIYQ